jgi:hypothetical protein
MQPELRSSSPSGRYEVRVFPWEPRMSLWVETPELFDTASQKSVLRFTNTNWSLESAAWLSESIVKMRLRKYPGAHMTATYEVTINCENQTAIVESLPVESLSAIEHALEKVHARAGVA